MKAFGLKLLLLWLGTTAYAQHTSRSYDAALLKSIESVENQCIAWRRDLHQHPELGNRETRTAKIIAGHLRSLGIEVQEGVAKTGVVGVLKGGKPGPVIGLRADMDALPVTERGALPFASKVTTQYNGQAVGVMHACGHDTHVAMLLSTATVLSRMKKDLQVRLNSSFNPAKKGRHKARKAVRR
jgi:amidohydrolase